MSMLSRGQYSFYPVVSSTEPAFNSTLGSSGLYALESTTAPERDYDGPSGRAVRLASKAADDFSVIFGTSDIVATSSGAMLILGGTVETFRVRPEATHVMVFSSTDVEVNVMIGYGQ